MAKTTFVTSGKEGTGTSKGSFHFREESALTSGDVTPQRVRKSIIGKRLVKWGTVRPVEKIRFKLEKQREPAGKPATGDRSRDIFATDPVSTLTSLSKAPSLLMWLEEDAFFLRVVIRLNGSD